MTGSESLYIDGRVEGSINLAGNRVTVGRNGVVAANINAREIVVLGKVRGNLTASDRVDIRSDGSLTGDVVAARISIEDGAFFKGGIDIRKGAQTGPEGRNEERFGSGGGTGSRGKSLRQQALGLLRTKFTAGILFDGMPVLVLIEEASLIGVELPLHSMRFTSSSCTAHCDLILGDDGGRSDQHVVAGNAVYASLHRIDEHAALRRELADACRQSSSARERLLGFLVGHEFHGAQQTESTHIANVRQMSSSVSSSLRSL